jgi:hypothetical protein
VHDGDMVGFADERGSAGGGGVQFQGLFFIWPPVSPGGATLCRRFRFRNTRNNFCNGLTRERRCFRGLSTPRSVPLLRPSISRAVDKNKKLSNNLQRIHWMTRCYCRVAPGVRNSSMMVGQRLGPRLSFLSLAPMFAKPLGALRTSSRYLAASRIVPRPCAARRALSTSLPSLAAQPQPIRTVFDVHTVEDLQHLSAEEALHEHGRTNSSLRHFTGAFLSEFLVLLD